MSDKKILISQSNYIPWKGYFDNIAQCDVFVVYDDMQYTRRDWRNRNYIKTPQGLQWLTIPVEVKGKFNQKINETRVSDKNWNKLHWQQIKQVYSKSPCYKDQSAWLEELYHTVEFDTLTEINLHFLKAICSFLNINTEFRDSREFSLAEEKTDRLVKICCELGGTDYFSGPAAKDYMDEDKFTQAGIQLHYFEYSGYREYPQLYPPFQHGVSIIDMILNLGNSTREYLTHCNY